MHNDKMDAAVIRASRKDPAAFGTIFDRHWPRIYRYCAERAGPAAGEDVAAETFRVAFTQRERYDGREDAAPWLYGIANNLLRRWFRAAGRGSRAMARAGVAVSGEEFEELEELADRLDAEFLSPVLASVLAKLSPADRDTLLLHAFADLTYEQIARATDVPIGTVGSRINRARALVRAHLETLELCS
jgi:RNA polymerase sigma factor (sigma-70 family)